MQENTNFNVVVPLVKATKRADGSWWVHGVASDESLDLQGEVTLASGLKDSLPYLRKHGHFNDNHKPVDVGKVAVANVVTKGSLVDQGVLTKAEVPETQRGDEVLYVGGPLYKHIDRARYYRNILRSGGNLGLSIQGAVLKREVAKSGARPVNVNTKCFINKIAVTDEPVNPNTWVSLKKSFGGKSAALGLMRAIAKALTTGGGIVSEGQTGGGVLRQQSLEGAKRKRRRRPKEANMEGNFRCHLSSVEKSLGGLSFSEISSKVYRLLNPRPEPAVPESGGWVGDVYDDHVIISRAGKSFSYPFSVKGGEVSLGDPTEVEKFEEWRPVKKAEKSLGKIDVGMLDTPARIAKAWHDLANPQFVKGVDPESVGAAKHQVREAAKTNGLSKAIEAEKQSTGALILTKALTESDILTLRGLEAMSDEEFTALVDADVEALKKSLAEEASAKEQETPAAQEPDPVQKSAASDKENETEEDDEDEDDLEDEDEEDEEDEDEETDSGGKAKKSLMDLLGEDEDTAEAFDLAPALEKQAEILSKSFEGLQDTISAMPEALIKSLADGIAGRVAQALDPVAKKLDIIAGLAEKFDSLEKSQATLQQELDQVGRIPSPAAPYRVLQKGGGGDDMSPAEVKRVLCAAAREGIAAGTLVTEYELSGQVNPNLVKSLKDKLTAEGKLAK